MCTMRRLAQRGERIYRLYNRARAGHSHNIIYKWPPREANTHAGTSPNRERWVGITSCIHSNIYIYIPQVPVSVYMYNAYIHRGYYHRPEWKVDQISYIIYTRTDYYKLFKRSKCYRFRSFGHTPRVTIFVY